MSEEFKPLEVTDLEPKKTKKGIWKYLDWGLLYILGGFYGFLRGIFGEDGPDNNWKTTWGGLALGMLFGFTYLSEIGFFEKPSRQEKIADFFKFLRGILKFFFWVSVIFLGGWLVIAGFSALASMPVQTLLVIIVILLIFK